MAQSNMLKLERACATLTEQGLAYVREHNDGQWRYHNSAHTAYVVEQGRRIAELAVDSGRLLLRHGLLVPVAAAFHDAVFNGETFVTNEMNSARLVREQMRRIDVFTAEDIDIVAGGILATQPKERFPRIVQQPLNKFDQIICDADLASFGDELPVFLQSGRAYYQEQNSKDDNPTRQFMEGQVVLLGNHAFLTPEAQELFPHAQENRVHIQQILAA
jgi:hypothetical protein